MSEQCADCPVCEEPFTGVMAMCRHLMVHAGEGVCGTRSKLERPLRFLANGFECWCGEVVMLGTHAAGCYGDYPRALAHHGKATHGSIRAHYFACLLGIDDGP